MSDLGDVTIVKRGGGATGRHNVVADLTPSTSYASGGDVFTDAQLAVLFPEGYGLGDVITAFFQVTDGLKAELDRDNGKLLIYDDSGQATGDLSGSVIRGEFTFGQIVGAY